MTENPQEHQGGPDEVPTEEALDIEGPNESAQPSGAPGLEGDGDEQGGGGNPSDPSDST